MQAYVTCKSKKINEMGRVEIAILDENSKVLSKIAMNDLYWQAEQNFGTMVIGYDNKPGKTGLIYESGDYPNTWNQYFGRVWIARTGNVWEAYISKFLPEQKKMIQSVLHGGQMKITITWKKQLKYRLASCNGRMYRQ